MLKREYIRVMILALAANAALVRGTYSPNLSWSREGARAVQPSMIYCEDWYDRPAYSKSSRNYRDLISRTSNYGPEVPNPSFGHTGFASVSPYAIYSRKSRSRPALNFPSEAYLNSNAFTFPVEAFRDPLANFGAESSFRTNDVPRDQEVEEYEQARSRRLFVVPRADAIDAENEPILPLSDSVQTQPITRSISQSDVPAALSPMAPLSEPMTDQELENVVKEAISTTRQQRQQEEALYRSIYGGNLVDGLMEFEADPQKRSQAIPFRANDVLYVAQPKYNPHNIPVNLNLARALDMIDLASIPGEFQMKGQEFELEDDVNLGDIKKEDSSEGQRAEVESLNRAGNREIAEKENGKEETAEGGAPIDAFGEVVVPVARKRYTGSLENFDGKLSGVAYDHNLKDDVVLDEKFENEDVPDRNTISASLPSSSKSRAVMNDPNLMEDMKNPPTATESTKPEAKEQSITAKN